MGDFTKSLRGKVTDRIIDYVAPLAATGMSWFFVSSLWAGWRSIAIAISTGFCVLGLILVYKREHRTKPTDRQQRKEMEYHIASLDPDEWIAVNAFMQGHTNTIEYDIDDPVIAGLRAKSILFVVSRNGRRERGNDGRMRTIFPVMLAPLANKCWEDNPPPQWHSP